MHQQLDKSAGNASLNDCLDLVIGTVGQVRDGPAGIDEDLIIKGVDELSKYGQSRSNLKSVRLVRMGSVSRSTHGLPVWLRRLSTAEIAEGPGGVPQHAQLPAVAKQSKERTERPLLQNKIPARRAISGNVTESPNSLLTDIWLVAAEQLDENWDCTSFNYHLCLLSGAGCDVRESP